MGNSNNSGRSIFFKCVAGIAVSVISAILIYILIPEKNGSNSEHINIEEHIKNKAGTLRYDDFSHEFTLEYPLFLGGVTKLKHGVVFGSYVKPDAGMIKKLFFRKKLDMLEISVFELTDDSKMRLVDIIKSQLTTFERLFSGAKIVTTQKGPNFIYIVRKARYTIGTAFLISKVIFAKDREKYIIAYAIIEKKNWEKYNKDICDSFASLKFTE